MLFSGKSYLMFKNSVSIQMKRARLFLHYSQILQKSLLQQNNFRRLLLNITVNCNFVNTKYTEVNLFNLFTLRYNSKNYILGGNVLGTKYTEVYNESHQL
ncbi:hypothetical protein A21D_02640 [Virgibacillus dokdonensis]|uniref:Uncharacterized protein n=1 Tax=Virgibacillus dokdonensis TaxID=302167 RepID=A0A2K9J1B7_9BACI|nr:hypothetical protein A21D_02640 [Virgibacillus dokdonensis]